MNSLVASNKVIVDQSLLSHTATAAPTAAAMAVAAAAGAPGVGHAVDVAAGGSGHPFQFMLKSYITIKLRHQ
jgi:hypothetical protein